MNTYFAAAERSSKEQLASEIVVIDKSPVVSTLMSCVGGLLALLNEKRQVVAVNTSFLQYLGIENPMDATGLRPGEVLDCIHAHDSPSGCGTTRYCTTCGAAIAMVACQAENKPIDRTCQLVVDNGNRLVDRVFSVRAFPMVLEGRRFILLFLRDVTRQHQQAALERTFFHDISNVLNSLLGASELMLLRPGNRATADSIYRSAVRLSKDVALQRNLFGRDDGDFKASWGEVTSEQINDDLEDVFLHHPAAVEKELLISHPVPAHVFKTDPGLYLRVAGNMVTNALEATAPSGTVKVWYEYGEETIDFKVWNNQQIPEDTALRVFQKNFSTKSGEGRGIGTYAMKLIGETILGGRVTFITSAEGTVFSFSLQR